MEKQKNSQLFVIVVLSIVLLTMSVGFAAFSSNLNISGNVTIHKAKWDVKFDTSSYVESTGSVSVAADKRSLTGTTMTYSVSLDPEDYYEFTINVINSGTFDAKLTKITLNGVPSPAPAYLEYSLFYNGTEYTSTTDGLSLTLAKASGSPLTPGTVPVKVRVYYKTPANAEDLPSSNVDLTLSASLDYVQVEN